MVNRGTIRSKFEIGKMAQVVKSNKVFTTMIEGLTRGPWVPVPLVMVLGTMPKIFHGTTIQFF